PVATRRRVWAAAIGWLRLVEAGNSSTAKKTREGKLRTYRQSNYGRGARQIRPARGRAGSYSTPTARDMSRMTIVKEMQIWTIARILAHRANSGASVGPKVELCVSAIKR